MSDGLFNALHESAKRLNEEAADPAEHPFNQMRARKGAEAMAKIAKHYKKDVKDLTNDEIVRYNQRNFKQGDPQLQEAAAPPARPQNGTKGFRITYEIVTPESCEQGEPEESGFLNEEGESMDPDPGDEADGLETAVDRAIKFLKANTGDGGLEWSGGWWTSYKTDVDYQTGGEESRGYHPYGFTQEDIDAINSGLKGR